jgi:arylsulfatase A-like enzyme
VRDRAKAPGRAFALFGLVLVASIGAGCRPREAVQRRPHILVVVFDTTRVDDWSYSTPSGSLTPTLDGLAERGFRFTNARSLYTWTIPSHITLFTGHAAAPPLEYPLRELAPAIDPKLEDERSSIVTLLGQYGYGTYAFSGNPNVSAASLPALRSVQVTSEAFDDPEEDWVRELLVRYGAFFEEPERLDDEARDELERWKTGVTHNAERVTTMALDAIERHAREHADDPFFLFVNYNDAHAPYFPWPPWDERVSSPGASDFNGNTRDPARRRIPVAERGSKLEQSAEGLTPADMRRARDLHLGELAYADHWLGKLLAGLDRLGVLDSTLIVATADHGELFGEHGLMSHAHPEGYEELLRVPLTLVLPAAAEDFMAKPGSIDALVDLRDVKPTLLDYLGIADDSATGRSLLPLLRDASAALRAPTWEPTDNGGLELLETMDPAARHELARRLRALGYID